MLIFTILDGEGKVVTNEKEMEMISYDFYKLYKVKEMTFKQLELKMNILQLILKKLIEAIFKKKFNLQPNQWSKTSHLVYMD